MNIKNIALITGAVAATTYVWICAVEKLEQKLINDAVNHERHPDYASYFRKVPMASTYGSIERVRYRWLDYVFPSRSDAIKALTEMRAIIYTSGHVTVADLNDIIGHPSSSKDEKMGWRDIDLATIVEESNRCVVKFPQPIFLGKVGSNHAEESN